LKVAEGDE
jgi:hypothetical protein